MIIPAILEQDIVSFNAKVKQIGQLKVDRVQVDFCDGDFVSNKTLLIESIPVLDKKYEWEAHIMAKNPVNFESYQAAGFAHLIIHYEAFESEVMLEDALLEIAKLEMTPALAVNPETNISLLRYFTDTIANFTILSVHPGMQGQSFIEETLDRIAQLREIAPDATIEVDGGVNSNNAKSILDAGANHIAVGSALFETEDIKKNYKAISDAIK